MPRGKPNRKPKTYTAADVARARREAARRAREETQRRERANANRREQASNRRTAEETRRKTNEANERNMGGTQRVGRAIDRVATASAKWVKRHGSNTLRGDFRAPRKAIGKGISKATYRVGDAVLKGTGADKATKHLAGGALITGTGLGTYAVGDSIRKGYITSADLGFKGYGSQKEESRKESSNGGSYKGPATGRKPY